MANKKKPVKKLEEAVSAKDIDTILDVANEYVGSHPVQQEKITAGPADDEGETDLKMTLEAMAKFRKSIRDAHQTTYRATLENIDKIISEVAIRLRRYEEATDELSNAQDVMHNLEGFVSRQRYTMPIARIAYVDRDVKLNSLAEINLLIISGRYPTGADGKSNPLTPMQQAALWY